MSFATRLASNNEQENAIKTIEYWLKRLGKVVVGGTTIGKYYDTVILDITHNGSEIYIHSNGWDDTDHGYPGVEVNGIHITGPNKFEEFKKAIEII